MRIFQICLMAFVVATCYLNVGKDTLDDGEGGRRPGPGAGAGGAERDGGLCQVFIWLFFSA